MNDRYIYDQSGVTFFPPSERQDIWDVTVHQWPSVHGAYPPRPKNWGITETCFLREGVTC